MTKTMIKKSLRAYISRGGIELFPADDCMSIVVRIGPSKILTDEVKAEVERLLDIKYIEKIVPGLSGLD